MQTEKTENVKKDLTLSQLSVFLLRLFIYCNQSSLIASSMLLVSLKREREKERERKRERKNGSF